MREALAGHKELAKRLDELERKVGTHDRAVGQILEAIRQLTQPPDGPRRRRIGFLQRNSPGPGASGLSGPLTMAA